ncbi:hypothetical protein GYMLUDRAFT_36416 [Collybiopsis luxurians FD-317 M1]|nr:hypothetical protein GYMLUDRAFT_36416 [Collybiopsis luxurians FD-317 M1]
MFEFLPLNVIFANSSSLPKPLPISPSSTPRLLTPLHKSSTAESDDDDPPAAAAAPDCPFESAFPVFESVFPVSELASTLNAITQTVEPEGHVPAFTLVTSA